MPKVAICTPTRAKPSQPFLDALAASVPVLDAAGWENVAVYEVGCPYISHARATLLRKALDAGCDAVIFIDDDVSWPPDGLLRLLQTEGDVVAGTYRYKREPEEYMGAYLAENDGSPVVRMSDGCISMHSVPAGFLKVTRAGVASFMRAYPELVYGDPTCPHIDLFNHGAWGGVWWGEDFAFARRWREKCGPVWLVPDIDIDHHAADACYAGNYHRNLMRVPGSNPDAYERFKAKDG
jgi:glycosyltransferase involved in cell wall biosynthesis